MLSTELSSGIIVFSICTKFSVIQKLIAKVIDIFKITEIFDRKPRAKIGIIYKRRGKTTSEVSDVKKLILITGAILLLYLVVMSSVAPAATTPSATVVPTQESTAENGYIIGISEGRVTVFKDGEMMLRTDTQLSDLPKSDRVRLEEGVHIDSLKELKERLEDYCS